uniref:Uncharacterized protein n=1 Tax=Escherichia coli TaxID=562 RepID=A0A1X9QDD8_ECOLX|nr:hypothetical protein [Escherichia coli]
MRRRPYVWMAQKIPGSSPRFRAAYSRFSTARRHTSFSSQRLLSNTGHSVSGRVKTRCTQSQSGRRFSCVAVQVTEAQACPSVVMSQSGSRYWWLLQITTQVACRIPPSGCLLRHVHMPVFSAGFQHQASPL